MELEDYQFTKQELKYLELLSEKYPTVQSVCTEIINLKAILNLPKGTEHFMSDVHGEYEAFYHILNNCSGVIHEKVNIIFGDRVMHINLLSGRTLGDCTRNHKRFGKLVQNYIEPVN